MAKDYTDYFAQIHAAEKRVVSYHHFKAKDTMKETVIEHNGREYVFDRDRAYLTTYKPWMKWDWKRLIWSINELLRSKKVGCLLFQEPLPGADKPTVTHEDVDTYSCRLCEFTTHDHDEAEAHVTDAHNGAKYDFIITKETEYVERLIYPAIQPIHISRMHQPSGAIKDA